MAELDTDINNVRQDKTNLPQWPALVHKFNPETGAFAHKRVETAREQAQWVEAGWFKTPLEAESAATNGQPHRTVNEPVFGDDVPDVASEPEADAPNQTKGRRR